MKHEPMLNNLDAAYILHLLEHDKNITEKMSGKISPESIMAKLDQIARCEALIKNVNRLYGSDYKQGKA